MAYSAVLCWRGMPVNSTHPSHDQFAESWQRVRDVLAGEDAVKAGGIRYVLPIGPP